MPSFDIVSELDMHEVSNAVDQSNREIQMRYDFKGVDARFEQNDSSVIMHAGSRISITAIIRCSADKDGWP